MSATGVIGMSTIGTYAAAVAIVAALALPLYQLRRDGLLPPLRRRGR